MGGRDESTGGVLPDAGVPKLEGQIVSMYTRRSDLGDELPEKEQKAKLGALGYARFTRECIPHGRFGPLGLEKCTTFQKSYRAGTKNLDRPERGVLVVTTGQLAALTAYAKETPLREASTFVPGCFGEQVCVDGGGALDSTSVCVGDEFGVFRKRGTSLPESLVLKLQVASPRRPCSLIDLQHGKTYTPAGIRAHVARTSDGGVFFRVLGGGGDAEEGDAFRLLKRPHPTWPVRRVAALIYGNEKSRAYAKAKALNRADWCGTQAELEELAAVEPLAICEYKDELHEMLGWKSIGRYRATPAPKAKSSGPSPLLALLLAALVAAAAAGVSRGTFAACAAALVEALRYREAQQILAPVAFFAVFALVT